MINDVMKAAKRAAVPIVSIDTADPAETIKACCAALNGKGSDTSFIQWDICLTARGLNEKGDAVIGALSDGQDPRIAFGNPAEMLSLMLKAPERTVLFMHNAHRFISNEAVMQAVWNVRDVWKARKSMLVLLGPAMSLPDELKQDVMCYSEDLPEEKAIEGIVKDVIKNANEAGATISMPEGEGMSKVCDTLTGLSSFAIEQTFATCLSKDGIDLDNLWERKRRAVEQTEGLAIWRGGEKFDDLGGCDNIKSFSKALMTGRRRFSAIGWLDEIEKMLAGSRGDTSGTSADQLGVVLRVMQDWNIPGILFIGHPGTAKSAITKAMGNEFGRPIVQMDLGAMKGSLVGESERKIRMAMKVFKAISSGRGLMVATCNKLEALPPELRRRFNYGTWFFDLPTREEQDKIWPIYYRKYELGNFRRDALGFDDTGWTGAEIKAVCETAWSTGMEVAEASKFVVPVMRSASEAVEQLRTLANGRFVSASKSGVYVKPVNYDTGKRAVSV